MLFVKTAVMLLSAHAPLNMSVIPMFLVCKFNPMTLIEMDPEIATLIVIEGLTLVRPVLAGPIRIVTSVARDLFVGVSEDLWETHLKGN